MKLKRALLSVYRKDNIAELAKFLIDNGVEILSTGNTFRFLLEKNLPVIEVSDYTGSPEILNGRVKTLHPKIHGGILSTRDEVDMPDNIPFIDLVVVDLYPFFEALEDSCATDSDIIEKIDIGGVTLLRSAAKNYKHVLPICDVADYSDFMQNFSLGIIDETYRKKMAGKVFQVTSTFDSAVANWIINDTKKSNEKFSVTGSKAIQLRCGENPHQSGAFFKFDLSSDSGFKQLAGKELGYNNIIDMESAYKVTLEFEEPVAVIVKHANPCGAAIGQDSLEAYEKAFSCDTISNFGSCIAFNRVVNAELASRIVQDFVEVVIAPDFEDSALKVFATKKRLRLVSTNMKNNKQLSFKSAFDGFLVQEKDNKPYDFANIKCVTKAQIKDSTYEDLLFAWKICKHVKSNAIVLAKGGKTIGIGAGQMSRIDSVNIAIDKNKVNCSGAALASDAFFPFSDSIVKIAEAGVVAIIQPGGSIRDKDVIEEADKNNLIMLFTSRRSFLH